MKIIAEYVDHIDDELEGAKDAAERYLYAKSLGDSKTANLYYEIAQDELKHSTYYHEMAVQEIKRIKDVFKPTEAMQDAWDKSHVRYVEIAAWVRKMLEM